MSDFKSRMHDEAIRIRVRLLKLEQFIDDNMFVGLSFNEQCMLKTQATFMKGYLDTLNMRIVQLMNKEKV